MMKKKLLAGLLSLVLMAGQLQPVFASDDADMAVSEAADAGEEESYEPEEEETVVLYDTGEAGENGIIPLGAEAAGSYENVKDLTGAEILAKTVKIAGKYYDLDADVVYYRTVGYTGKKIKPGTDLFAVAYSESLEALAAELLGTGKVDLSEVLQWKFSAKKNKKVGSKSYFTLSISVKKSAAKKIGLKGKAYTNFKKGVKKINSAAKSKKYRMYFLIVSDIDKDVNPVMPTRPAEPTPTRGATPTPAKPGKATPTPKPTGGATGTPTPEPTGGAAGTPTPTGGAAGTPTPTPTEADEPAEIKPVKINAVNFPDTNFRKIIGSVDYDRDLNGILDEDEIFLIRNVSCEESNVRSVQGIELFPELIGLWCKDNNIKSIDVTHNPKLTGIWCSGNPLTSLDLSRNPELLWVYCYDCKLTALDVSHNPKMAFIECNTNPITELDLSNCPELEHLTCGTCELTELDLSNCPKLAHLDAFQNHLTELDVTVCPKMKRLDVWNNVVKEYPGEPEKEVRLGAIDISKCPELQYYNCAKNNVTSLDLSQNPELFKLICSYNTGLTKLDLSHNPKLAILNCECDPIETLDLSNNHYMHFLQAFGNSAMTSINIGDNPFLVKAYKEGVVTDHSVKLGKAIHSHRIDYGWDDSTGYDNFLFFCVDDVVKVNTESTGYELPSMDPYPYSDTGIAEDDLITRAEAVQKLYELAGKPAVSGVETRFKDVKGSQYEEALLWGESMHMLAGFPYVSDDLFKPDEWLTRQDAMLMLMRYSENTLNYKRAIDFGRSDDYLDYLDIDFWHWEPMCWAETWLIMPGREEGLTKEKQHIDPYGRVTGADMDLFIKNMVDVNK